MVVEHVFTIHAPRDRVARAMLDAATVLRCLPGSRLVGVEGSSARGRLRLPLGPTTITYEGSITVAPNAGGGVVVSADASEVRGGGALSANLAVTLRDANGLTSVSVVGEGTLGGRAAGVEPATLQRSSINLVRRFGRRLESAMSAAAEPGSLIDPQERLEATISALTELERRTQAAGVPTAATGAGRQGPTRPDADVAPSLSGAPETPAEHPIPGRVTVVTDQPLVFARHPSALSQVGERFRDELDERPWIMPLSLLSATVGWLLLRRATT